MTQADLLRREYAAREASMERQRTPIAPHVVPPAEANANHVVLRGIPYEQYVALRDVTEGQGLRFAYLDGILEIMSPSDLHEEAKKLLARLLETWAVERDVDIRAFGSTTWRSAPKTAGVEADECYKFGKLLPGDVPELAIEVSVSGERLEKLQIYARLGVQEVWRWSPSTARVIVSVLVGDEVVADTGAHYEHRDRSQLLPELDLVTLARFVQQGLGENQTQLLRAYRATL